METDDKNNDDDPEWETRTLCPDGNCIGVIGTDGRCRECGVMFSNPSAEAQKKNEETSTPANTVNQDIEPEGEWENRRLCPDGNCIGIIGPDGRCGICGKEG